ncbi:MAG: hypothetical protein R2719_15215 [Micropruina sp.]
MADLPFRNPGLTVEERVEDLLGRLSLEEKAGQVTQYFYFGSDQVEAAVAAGRRRLAAVRPRTRRPRTGCSGWRSRAAGSASRCCSGST